MQTCTAGQWVNRELFDLDIETRLAPPSQSGDVISRGNRAAHPSPRAAHALKAAGARFLYLPPCSPGLNPNEMAFSKLKALIRTAAARTCDQL